MHRIQTLREAGRPVEAAELARRAGAAWPESPDLFYLELVTRSAQAGEELVLEELAARLQERGPAAVRMRVSLANRRLMRGEPEWSWYCSCVVSSVRNSSKLFDSPVTS